MRECDYCQHVEMCRWRKELEERGCDFFDGGNKWIPISERLPDKNVEVLVTTEWDCITIGEMFSINDWFIHEGATNADIDDIKAWMPLPKPYKAEGSDKE